MSAGMAARPPVRAVLALGSNLGDRLDHLQGGLDALAEAPGLDVVAVSPVYETAPVGGPDQPRYLNAVLLAETALSARTLLERCHSAETALGRTREEVWGPRTLDVDLIVYGDRVSERPELTLPHPRAHQRAFVLTPWLEVDPGAALPGHGRVADLAAAADQTGVRRLNDVSLRLPA